jgi:hypothetical protein
MPYAARDRLRSNTIFPFSEALSTILLFAAAAAFVYGTRRVLVTFLFAICLPLQATEFGATSSYVTALSKPYPEAANP